MRTLLADAAARVAAGRMQPASSAPAARAPSRRRHDGVPRGRQPLPKKNKPSASAGRREFSAPTFVRGEPLELAASGFPTRGRAHPSARGSSLVRTCREKNRSPCRTAQKVRSQDGQTIRHGQARSRGQPSRSRRSRIVLDVSKIWFLGRRDRDISVATAVRIRRRLYRGP
jgi:hypothetical protein